jgi:hypothetical protein
LLLQGTQERFGTVEKFEISHAWWQAHGVPRKELATKCRPGGLDTISG